MIAVFMAQTADLMTKTMQHVTNISYVKKKEPLEVRNLLLV